MADNQAPSYNPPHLRENRQQRVNNAGGVASPERAAGSNRSSALWRRSLLSTSSRHLTHLDRRRVRSVSDSTGQAQLLPETPRTNKEKDLSYIPPHRRRDRQQMVNNEGRVASPEREADTAPSLPLRTQNVLSTSSSRQRDEHLEQTAEPVATTAPPSALLSANSASSSPPPQQSLQLSNLDRHLKALTPTVRVQLLPEMGRGGQQYFSLGDLWKSFEVWSIVGAGVFLDIPGNESTKQHYNPTLSGIQLYIDPQRTSDAETSSRSQEESLMDSDSSEKVKRFSSITDKDTPPPSNNIQLAFQYLETDKPHERRPLFGKVSELASAFPGLKLYRSCDLLPESWLCVAWYPIYAIYGTPTLQRLDAKFLTFHALTHSTKEAAADASSSRSNELLSLPIFGLVSHKLFGSVLAPNSPEELQKLYTLTTAADAWLKRLDVPLPDYHFFTAYGPYS